MKRSELLKQSLVEDKNVEAVIEKALKEDKRFLKRSKRSIEDEIEDLEVKLEERLSSDAPLDKSTIEVTFKTLKDKRDLLDLYKDFEEKYV